MSSYCVTFGLTFIPYTEALARLWPTPRHLLHRPDPRSHPVQIARQLLRLALLIRSLASEALEDLSRRLTTNATVIMALAFETATRYVTTSGELSGTIEAIECIMMEAMFQNNSGQIRLAFMACRRALVAGQMLGLDRGPKSPLIRLLDPAATLHRINPEYMWLRLVQMDTYLSMQLGLPQGAADNTFTTDAAALPPFERLERSLAVAGGRIIRRNCTARDDVELTGEIDDMMSQNYSIMPPQWWLCPDLASPGHDERTLLRETNRFMVQLTHFHMLEQLHLPFLLKSSSPPEGIYDYHKITGVSASREVLTRYVAFRSAMPPTATFCRGIDFLAFSASTVLCLGHMDARLRQSCPEAGGRRGPAGRDNTTSVTVSKYLAHHRSSDRGIMERTLARLEAAARERPSDPISKKVSLGLRHLLAVEADVANGMAYKVEPAYRDDDERDELGWRGQLHAEQDVLQVHIPHLGSIKIKPHGRRAVTVAGAQEEPALQDVSDPALPTLDGPNRGYDACSFEGQLRDPVMSSSFKGVSFDVGVPDTGGGDFRFNLDDFQEEQWFMPTFMFGDDWVRPN
ncbi:dehydrocurvularin biosynthesis regulator [Sarocladium implicatum]|nr:dehydrocurvularin biosynthesis regulator [Sarocladium implicatum]